MTDDKPNTLSVILKLLDDADGRFLELGSALVKLRADDPDAFTAVVNLPQLGKRRGYYLFNIGVAFGEKPHLHERLRRLWPDKSRGDRQARRRRQFRGRAQTSRKPHGLRTEGVTEKGASALGRLLAFALDGAEYAAVTNALKLIFDTSNVQAVDYKRKWHWKSAVALHSWRERFRRRRVGARWAEGRRRRRAARGWRRVGAPAQQETLAVLFDFGLGQEVEVCQNAGP